MCSYLKPCNECVIRKDEDATWCKFPEYCDIHLANGSVFEDVVQSSCQIHDATCAEDICFEFRRNATDEEGRKIIVRAGDIVAIVERHLRD